jgi:hypothetical protein
MGAAQQSDMGGTLPDAETLAASLHSILGENGCRDGRLSILHRTSNRCASTFAREIVTCRPADGTVRRFLCKYAQVTGSFDAAHRLVADLDYEAEVYRHVLRPINASTPIFYGTYKEAATRTLACLSTVFQKDPPTAAACQHAGLHGFTQSTRRAFALLP